MVVFGTILFTAFLFFLVLGIPVSFGLSIASIGAIFQGGYPIAVIAQRMFNAVNTTSLMAIPLFMLAGSLMGHGGISRRIIDFVLCIVGKYKGALAYVVAITGVILGGISGSGVADTAAIGGIMIPQMKEKGYDASFSAALTACSGAIGIIIPPSITIIIYGCTVNASIGTMFMAAILPGIAIGVGFLIYSYFVAKKYNYPCAETVSGHELWKRFKSAVWALMMPVIILVGIRGGVFTPTEGGAVISVYALLISFFVYKELKLRDLPGIFLEAAISAATIGMIIAATSLFSWLLTSERIPTAITNWMIGLTDNSYLLLLLINILLLFTGMFLDSGPAVMLLAPILAPVAQACGLSLETFGLVMVINLCMGLLTPPVGTAMYVSSNISGVGIPKLSRSLLPFLGIMFIVLMLITYIPGLTAWA